jgi:glutamate dehydrogenase
MAREEATPAEVIQAILMAPVDLLWFGGIGTYVRASSETDDEVGDRANDAVRITGAEVRARVVGEGANLGVTQRGRIEAARRGVRLNTDAIDNSAGVNTSDVEVNIKIALTTPQRQGLLSEDDRNALVAGMTDEVAELVLRNNRQQTLALSLASRPAAGASENGFAVRLMQMLEAEGRLDRTVEFLPSDATLAERGQRGEGLTRPEFAVLLAYAKLSLKSRLLDGVLPDDPVLALELDHYFPQALRERFPEAIAGHRLRREIIATELANAVVNLGGPTIVPRLVDETGAADGDVATAYVAVRDVFGLPALYQAVERLDRSLAGEQQLSLYAELQDVLRDRMVWVLRNADLTAGLGPVIGRFAAGAAAVARTLPDSLGPQGRDAHEQRRRSFVDGGVPEDLAERLASLRDLAAAPDIVLVAEDTGRPLPETAATYYALADRFRLEPLAAAARRVPAGDIFDRVALERAIAGIGATHRALCRDVIRNGGSGADAVGHWCEARGQALGRTETALDNILGSGLTLSKVMVATSLLGDLGRV